MSNRIWLVWEKVDVTSSPYATRSPPERTIGAITDFTHTPGGCKAPHAPWKETESLSSLYSNKPKSHSHPISIPSAYNSETSGESLTPPALSVGSPTKNPLIKKRPPELLHLSESLGSVYVNSDTSTPVGPSPFHGSYKFESGGIIENRNLSTPDSPLTVSSQLDKDHRADKSSTSESGSENWVLPVLHLLAFFLWFFGLSICLSIACEEMALSAYAVTLNPRF